MDYPDMYFPDQKAEFLRGLATVLWDMATDEQREVLVTRVVGAHVQHLKRGIESGPKKPQGLSELLVGDDRWIIRVIDAYQYLWDMDESHTYHCNLLDSQTGGMLVQDLGEAIRNVQWERLLSPGRGKEGR